MRRLNHSMGYSRWRIRLLGFRVDRITFDADGEVSGYFVLVDERFEEVFYQFHAQGWKDVWVLVVAFMEQRYQLAFFNLN